MPNPERPLRPADVDPSAARAVHRAIDALTTATLAAGHLRRRLVGEERAVPADLRDLDVLEATLRRLGESLGRLRDGEPWSGR